MHWLVILHSITSRALRSLSLPVSIGSGYADVLKLEATSAYQEK